MAIFHILFWVCAVCVAYTLVGYPLLLALVAFFRKSPPLRSPFTGTFSIVVAARNEEANLSRRLREIIGLIDGGHLRGDIVVVSDGSTDCTVDIARGFETKGLVRVVECSTPQGKSAALTEGCQSCKGDVLVFADARQRWDPDALALLLENFADPRIGAVSGDLNLETETGVMAGVGLYWRLEKWIRQKESLIYSQVGVTGAISAVRRPLFRPIPAGTLLDDVYWPLQVAMQGYRVVHDPRARAFDRLPDKPQDEFRRKIRTLAGNFQLVNLLPSSLLPWRNPIWIQWVSHKLLRLAVPWALLGLLICSSVLEPFWFQAFFWAQLAGYGLALAGLLPAWGCKVPFAATAASFLALNLASFLAFWVWVSGRAGLSWGTISYSRK